MRWLLLALILIFVLVSAQAPVSRKPPTKLVEPKDIGKIIPSDDPRIEAIARVICKARGIDPDYTGPLYPYGPIWRMFIPEAREAIMEYDVLHRKNTHGHEDEIQP